MRAHQGLGIGRALIAAAEAQAAADGHAEVTLTTYLEVPWNAPFYRRLGFADFVPGPDRPDLLKVQADEAAWGFARWPRGAMRKPLRPAGPAGKLPAAPPSGHDDGKGDGGGTCGSA
jgi:hypothetical protein